jgi:hypothetical protein
MGSFQFFTLGGRRISLFTHSVARCVQYTSAASLMQLLVKTPPPSLLRARFATVLETLPSVPTVVLPLSPAQKAGLSSFIRNYSALGGFARFPVKVSGRGCRSSDCYARSMFDVDREPRPDTICHKMNDAICRSDRICIHPDLGLLEVGFRVP